jgi:hypothetical protein
VLKKAGAWFLYGWPPDDAILIGLEQIVRMNAIVEAVLTVEPDADRDDLTNMAHDRWYRSTDDAVTGIVSALGLRRDRRAEAEATVVAAVDKSESPIRDADRAAVIEKATEVLTGWPNSTARHAVSLAVDIVRDQSVEDRQTVDKAARAEAEAAIVAAIPFAKPSVKDEDHGRIIAIGAHLMTEDPDLAADDAVRQAVKYWQDQRRR